MMDWTDRHCRYFHRLLSPDAWLYTEMVTTGAILHGSRPKLLDFNDAEHPVALQLGGSDQSELAECAQMAQEWGYDEVNLNVGCPSDRVQKGRFGACLMLEPELVRDCMAAMIESVDIPVTFKCRLGVDDHYSYEYFRDFVQTVMESGTQVLIAHARKAVLAGLSPKQNREVPPLHHDWVYRLKQEMPELQVVINGGIASIESATEQLQHVDGVMLGRAAYQTPWILAECQREFLSGGQPESPDALIEPLTAYLEQCVSAGLPITRVTRHVLGLFQGRPGAKVWRRHLSQNAHQDRTNTQLLCEALERVRDVTANSRDVACA
jgi:tRNA-dihydrouridine synthase A